MKVMDQLQPFSTREGEILSMLAQGVGTDEVATKLDLSAHTVRTHVKNAMRKCGARTRTHAVAILLRQEYEPGVCIGCGCTELEPCVHDVKEMACGWAAPGICTACVRGASEDWQHPFEDGDS